MARDRELSRSPSYKRRRYSRSPSPKYNNRRDRTRRDRDRSSYNYSRRKSRSLSPRHRRRRSHSPTSRRHRSRSLTSRRHKRQKRKSPSLSPKAKSPSIGSLVNKIMDEKLNKEQEDEKKRRQQEAELKLVEEEMAKRVEEAIRKKVEERLGSEEIKLEIERQLEDGRKKKEEQAKREKEELERLIEQNKRRIKEAQMKEAMEQQRREEEHYRELEELQRQKEEALLRKKQQREEERVKQQKLLGKNKSRPKLSFALDTLSSCSNFEAQQMQQIQDKAKKSCMVSFRKLHSHLKRLSQNDLQGSQKESGFKGAFATFSGQDTKTFKGTMFLNVEQQKSNLTKKTFKKLDPWLFLKTESKEQDTSSRLGNDAHDDDANIRPIYDEELTAEVQTTTEIDVFVIGQQHTDQPEFNNEGRVVQNAEECHDTCPLPAIVTDNQIPECSYQSLKSENILNKGQQSQFLKEKSNKAKVKHDIDVIETINIELEHKVAKLLKENESLKKNYKELFDSIKITRAKNTEHTTSLIATNAKFKAQLPEKGFAIAALKSELRKSTGNSVNTMFTKFSILGKPMLQPLRNQSVVRQPTAFKSERPKFSMPRCDSQVNVHNDLSKPVTTHYLPKEIEAASAKPHHMIASSNSRIISRNMSKFSSIDMVYNYYLEVAKKKTKT
nr:hypothetical protein [Tanacetum cinerariifolium]